MVCYDNTHYDQASTVENYGLCRHIPAAALDMFARTLIEFGNKSAGSPQARILEEGVGNGRIFIPAIKESMRQGRNDSFFAVDRSRLMLDDLERRLGPEERARCRLELGDIQEELPFDSASFDCIYTFAVYHILTDPWAALDEMTRILKPTGYFVYGKEFTQVFHGTEKKIAPEDCEDLRNADLIPAIGDFFCEYHRLREKHGVPFVPSGVLYSDPSLITERLASKGFRLSDTKGKKTSYKKPHTLRQMLEAFRLRNITTFGSDIPDSTRLDIYADLLGWCNRKGHPLDAVMEVPASITVYAFSKNEK